MKHSCVPSPLVWVLFCFALPFSLQWSFAIELTSSNCLHTPCLSVGGITVSEYLSDLKSTLTSVQESLSSLACEVHAMQSSSCKELFDKGCNIDGKYLLKDGNVYECDMTNGGWTNIIDITPTSAADCQNTVYGAYKYHGCSSSTIGCSVFASVTPSFPVTKARGQVRGYQAGSLDAFNYITITLENSLAYVDGISFTTGEEGERAHLWTFAGGLNVDSTLSNSAQCPCFPGSVCAVPDYVGSHYYCNAGFETTFSGVSPNVLWDDVDCLDGSAPNCCGGADFPLFVREDLVLPAHTPFDVRYCITEGPENEDIILTYVNLWVM
eukprot:GCRY01000454.1.p1 GENE.GCRY01000454.1~~GCRY01000454.1.p1  ORF type:complete len:341 (+),score=52.35 GCRY01000454.1:53-1024(+)